jgi:hypothetical protein
MEYGMSKVSPSLPCHNKNVKILKGVKIERIK